MRYQVFENGKSCDWQGYPSLQHPCWETSIFDSLLKARDYLNLWCGCLGPIPNLNPGEKYDYSGYGDIVEIREIGD